MFVGVHRTPYSQSGWRTVSDSSGACLTTTRHRKVIRATALDLVYNSYCVRVNDRSFDK